MDEQTDQRIEARKRRRKTLRLDAAVAATRDRDDGRLYDWKVKLETQEAY